MPMGFTLKDEVVKNNLKFRNFATFNYSICLKKFVLLQTSQSMQGKKQSAGDIFLINLSSLGHELSAFWLF